MSRLLFKYNVASRGREGMDNTWIIHNLDNGESITTNHIEIKVPVTTNEKHLAAGFGMICEGEIEIKEHPSVGKFAVINKPVNWSDVSDATHACVTSGVE